MQTEDILGAAFHPLDDNLMITYGKGHLTFWTRRKDGFFEKIDIIKAVLKFENISSVYCANPNNENYLIFIAFEDSRHELTI